MIVDSNIGGSVTAPRIRVIEIDAFERDIRLRLPFRFGAATLEKGAASLPQGPRRG